MSIKVLHLIDSGGLYGAEVMLLNLVEEQIKFGLKPTILSAGAPGIAEKPLESEAEKRGFPVKMVRMNAGLNLIKAYQILSYAKAQGFDILHSHGYKFNILLGMIPGIIRKLPLITTLHGYVSAERISRLRLYQTIERMVLPYLDGIVFVSSEIKNNPVLKGFRAKYEATISNGINSSRVIESASSKDSVSINDIFTGESDGKIYLAAVGRLSPEKGFSLLVDVFGRLVSRIPDLRLIIIGEGELRQQLENKIKDMGLEDKVMLPGFINPVYPLIKEVDGVVMPSLTEGLPMTLLEACALRKRIVASDVGSISEVLQDYRPSLVVAPGDRKSLERAIDELIIGNIGKEVETENWASFQFGSEQMAERYLEFYESVISDRV